MVVARISGGEHAVMEIFSDRFLFRIPSYQRPYSWTAEQASELFEDLLRASLDDEDLEPDPYFLGSIVLAKEEGDPHAEVIDGQQRLTTITLLLVALAESLPAADGEKLRQFIRQDANKYTKSAAVPRLTLRERDEMFFRTYVQDVGGLARLLEKDPAQLANDAQRHIQANARLFVERLGRLSPEHRDRLGAFLLTCCYMVAVSTPNRDTAYRVFAVLNDRGLDLTHADIIKSDLIGRIDADERAEQCTKLWEDREAILGRDAFGDLFSHIRMIYARTKMRSTVVKEFRQYVYPAVTDPATFVETVVVPFADCFIDIDKATWASSEHAEAINHALTWLNRIDNFDWVPPAMLYMTRHGDDALAVKRFVERLERVAASMFIRRCGINERIERYGQMLQAIDDGTLGAEAGWPLDLTDREKQDTLTSLDGDVYSVLKTRLFVLQRLDESLSGGGATYDHKVQTVEHVLPQKPPAGSQWLRDFTPAQRERWTHRLANLVLLTRRKNAAANNYDFDTKKRRYFTGPDGTSPFALTTQVLVEPRWTPDVLAARQQVLLAHLGAVWDLT